MTVISYVFFNLDTGEGKELLSQVRKIPEVEEAHLTYGIYDMLVKIESENTDALKEIIFNKIKEIVGIEESLTMIVVD